MAVGQAYFGSSTYTPVASEPNGTTWTLDTTPSPAGGGFLNAVRAPRRPCVWLSARRIRATSASLEQWNGTAWARRSEPQFHCAGQRRPRRCVVHRSHVVHGRRARYDGTAYQTLIELWNGTSWSIIASPNSGTASNHLQAIVCFSETSCSAVGYTSPSPGNSNESLAWNGATWALATTPNEQGASDTQLNGVSCVTNWQCVATGFSTTGTPNPFVITAPIARSGYRFVASDGGVFNYGSGAPFLGSLGGTRLDADHRHGRHAGR